MNRKSESYFLSLQDLEQIFVGLLEDLDEIEGNNSNSEMSGAEDSGDEAGSDSMASAASFLSQSYDDDGEMEDDHYNISFEYTIEEDEDHEDFYEDGDGDDVSVIETADEMEEADDDDHSDDEAEEAYQTSYAIDEIGEEAADDFSTDNSVMFLDYSTFPVPMVAIPQQQEQDSHDSDDEVVFVGEDNRKKEVPKTLAPPRRSSIQASSLTCAICLDSLKEKNKPVSTNCGHLFCYACLTAAIEKSKKCPLCNTKQGSKTFHRIYF